MNWLKTTEQKPPAGSRIAIWFDDDIFSANVLANSIVNCPVLNLTWDLNEDPESEWFTDWQFLVPPKTEEDMRRSAVLDDLVSEGQALGLYDPE